MDHRRFDALTATVARVVDRRFALRGLLAVIVAGGVTSTADAASRKKKKRKRKRKKKRKQEKCNCSNAIAQCEEIEFNACCTNTAIHLVSVCAGLTAKCCAQEASVSINPTSCDACRRWAEAVRVCSGTFFTCDV